MVYIGLDIGSISINAVVMQPPATVLWERYARTHGQPLETTRNVLQDILVRWPERDIAAVAVTGSGGALVARLVGGYFVNEIIAQSKASGFLYPQVRTVVEIGGEDAKLIVLEPCVQTGRVQLKDFAINTVCAAGTGSFLDQQAARLGIRIENDFGRLALQSTHPPRIAGRCSVFAKSDMIHLQQVATPDYDIIMGLCVAMARNFKSNVAKARQLERPIAFQGGVAANAGMVRAFEMVLDLHHDELLIPQYFASMGAIGAVLTMLESGAAPAFRGLHPLELRLSTPAADFQQHEPLEDDGHVLMVEALPVDGPAPVEAYLGVDVGSISTNLVVIDARKRVIARRYLMTAGRPIDAVCRGLLEIGSEIGPGITIRGVTTTGSGRYLIGDYIGADFVKNEITAHARGAVSINPDVDTVFEIGGQDSKYISLKNGAVVDFTMNKVCAAGTGSFLEEQAEKIGISIRDEFGKLALSSASPVQLGERCTVFMESSLNHYQQLGVPKADLVAGLSYSIVLNYLNRVVEDRRVGDVIFFQGGTAYNRGVKAAFEKICGKKVTVPAHHDVLGALGCALIALENKPAGPSRFKGFDLAKRTYSVESFECTDCPNNCEIRTVSIQGDKPLHYGSRCGKFDEERRETRGTDLPHLFRERELLLMDAYEPTRRLPARAPTVGIPRATLFFELYPFWQAFFSELGFRVVTSPPTNRKIISRGCEAVLEEICFPIKVAHGHVLELLESGVDFLMLPCVVNMDHLSRQSAVSYNCLYVQSLPYLVQAAVDFSPYATRVLSPVLHFEWGPAVYEPQLRKLARAMGRSGDVVTGAIHAAWGALNRFRQKLIQRGEQVLAGLPRNRPALVIVSRPYNGCDPGLNFRIPDKLRDLGALAIPLDFLPLPDRCGPRMKDMYWRYGQRILAAARTIQGDPRLNAVYVSNFSCGPDSFITKYFSREMAGKPYLMLELDEHSADAGVITRLEAFLDSCAAAGRQPAAAQPPAAATGYSGNHRRVYVPYMDDHSLALAAAMRFKGVRAEALPMADESTVEIGRSHTTGRECYPCIITTGDMLKKAMSDDFDPACSGFFMASAMGPCRFGQYSRFHRMVLDDLGFTGVPIMLLDQTTNYEGDLSRLGNGFRLLGWQAIVLVDYMKKMLLQTRPYETMRGDTEAVYRECLQRLVQTLERHGSLGDCARYAVERFRSISASRAERKPLIGIVGEIFVRSNAFSNNFIIRTIESLGGEVVMPTLQEWVSYTDWERRKDVLREGDFRKFANEIVKYLFQTYHKQSIGRCFHGHVRRFFKELSTSKVMRLSSAYAPEDIRGEANLSIGRAVEYALHGIQGVVNLIPFNCLPGTIVNTLLCRYSQEYPHIPVLKMVYDGTRQAGDQTRIEAFMYQARQSLEQSSRKNGHRGRTMSAL